MSSLALCIPAYNTAWSLDTLFQSIAKQLIPFDEVLVYNDCSTDGTAAIARKMGATVIEGDINRGCSFGKNKLANLAKSEWLFFLDADDELLPNFTEVAKKRINESSVAQMILMGYSYVNYESGKINFEPRYDRTSLVKDPLRFMINNKIVNSSLIRRDAFILMGGFDLDMDLLFVEDRAFSIRAAIGKTLIDIEPAVCFKINFFPNSMSAANPEKWLKASVHLWERTYNKVGNSYATDICNQLFENAVWAAKYSKWDIVKKSLSLINKIKPGVHPSASKLFLFAYKISPFGAFYLRAFIIRISMKKKARA